MQKLDDSKQNEETKSVNGQHVRSTDLMALRFIK